MVRGDGNELSDLLVRFTAELSDLLWSCSSGADLDPLLALNLSLKGKKHFIFPSFRQNSNRWSNSAGSQSNPPLSSAQNEWSQHQKIQQRVLFHGERERERERELQILQKMDGETEKIKETPEEKEAESNN